MLIGISGKKQSGKDTAALIIFKTLYIGNKYIQIKRFADKLKLMTAILIDCDVSRLEDNYFKNSSLGEGWGDLTPRKILQYLGTEVGRNLHPDIWVNSLLKSYNPERDIWIIPDVRFPNEANAIKERGGILIRIDQPGLPEDNHPSETALDDYRRWDVVIHNDRSLENFNSAIKDDLCPTLKSI